MKHVSFHPNMLQEQQANSDPQHHTMLSVSPVLLERKYEGKRSAVVQPPSPETRPLESPQPNEYEFTWPKGNRLYFKETKDGETVFHSYRREPDGSISLAEQKQLIRNEGDAFVAIDGVSTTSRSYQEVMDMMKRSARKSSPVTFRMRDCKYAESIEEKQHELEMEIMFHKKQYARHEEAMLLHMESMRKHEIQIAKKEEYFHHLRWQQSMQSREREGPEAKRHKRSHEWYQGSQSSS